MIVLGIEIGGGWYETLVVMPVWALAPSDSVIAYHQHNVANPEFALNAGGRFWIFFTPLTGLMSLGTLISGLKTRPKHRKWRVTATVLAIISIN